VSIKDTSSRSALERGEGTKISWTVPSVVECVWWPLIVTYLSKTKEKKKGRIAEANVEVKKPYEKGGGNEKT
jgi:hypothetical protein